MERGRKMHKIQVGQRLRIAIEALGLRQVEVARSLGVTPSKLNNWLRGDNYPPHMFIVRLRQRYNITSDWLLSGEIAGLPGPLADDLWRLALASPPGSMVAADLGDEKMT